MSVKQRLLEDMKAAMRARDEGRVALATIRMVHAAIKNAEIEKRRELTEDEIIAVIAKEVKQRQDALVEFERGNRQDLVDQTEAEIAVLKAYLPQQLSEQEIREMAQQAIAAVGATGPRDMGKVMQALLPRVRGRADGKLVNQIVKELLG